MFKKIFYIKIVLIVFGLLLQPVKAEVWNLQQCIDTAIVNNKQLQISSNNIIIGKQKHKEAFASLIPKVNVSADYRYYTDQPTQLMPAIVFGGKPGVFKEAQFGVPHNINASLQLTLPLYNPQVYGAIQTTKVAMELSELQFKKNEEQLYFDISNLYYSIQIIQHQLIFIDSNLINSEKLLNNMQLLNEQGMIKSTDVGKVKLQYEQLITQKELIKSKYDQTLNALKFTMGISILNEMKIDTVINVQNNDEYISNTTIDVRLAQTVNRLVTSELRTLKLSRLPSINLYGTYGSTGFGYNEAPNEFLDFYPMGFAGVQLSYPLFNGTITQRKIIQKEIELQNSELQLSLATEQNILQIDNAKRQRKIAKSTISNTLSQIQLAQSIYEQTVLQQKQGIASLTDILLSDNALRESQHAYLTAMVDYLKADLEIKKMTGNISVNKIKN